MNSVAGILLYFPCYIIIFFAFFQRFHCLRSRRLNETIIFLCVCFPNVGKFVSIFRLHCTSYMNGVLENKIGAAAKLRKKIKKKKNSYACLPHWRTISWSSAWFMSYSYCFFHWPLILFGGGNDKGSFFSFQELIMIILFHHSLIISAWYFRPMLFSMRSAFLFVCGVCTSKWLLIHLRALLFMWKYVSDMHILFYGWFFDDYHKVSGTKYSWSRIESVFGQEFHACDNEHFAVIWINLISIIQKCLEPT